MGLCCWRSSGLRRSCPFILVGDSGSRSSPQIQLFLPQAQSYNQSGAKSASGGGQFSVVKPAVEMLQEQG